MPTCNIKITACTSKVVIKKIIKILFFTFLFSQIYPCFLQIKNNPRVRRGILMHNFLKNKKKKKTLEEILKKNHMRFGEK
jgi:hypothetical protein